MERKNRTKPQYPECEKMSAVQPKSQAIGEFLNWLRDEKGVQLAKYHEHSDACYEEDVEHEEGEEICERNEAQLDIFPVNMESLLAEYFEIDLKKVEEERREILADIREANKGNVKQK
jgi:hypothetical protein